MRLHLLMVLLLAGAALPAREATERYRQLLTAITYQGVTIGTPGTEAVSEKVGFKPLIFTNACTRRALGAPFAPTTELMLIYSVHGGRILGLRFLAHGGNDAAVAALKDQVAAITGLALALDAEGVEQDGVFLRWRTLSEEGEEPGRELAVYDTQLHDELRAADVPGK